MKNKMFTRLSLFTIVELLIVVSVICILMALLLPTLNKAKEKAQSISCVGNLKQLLAFSLQYSLENDDYIISGYHNGASNWSGCWFSTLLRSMEPNHPTGGTMLEPIHNKRVKKHIILCPSYRSSGNANKVPLGYSVNHNLSSKNPGGTISDREEDVVWRKITSRKAASKAFFIIDDYECVAATRSSLVRVMNLSTLTAARGGMLSSSLNPPLMRHESGAAVNVGWLDGHSSSDRGTNIRLDTYNISFWTGTY